MKKRILVITDCSDIAANDLYATLVTNLDNLNTNKVVVEPIVVVSEFSVLHASFVARLLAEAYNPDSLTILAVVNPLDTSTAKRARIAGRLKNGIKIVGANTGVFTWLINDYGLDEVCETDATGLQGKDFISFGGKYIHAPIAAKYAVTDDINSIKIADFTENDLMKLEYMPGMVLHIDNFGVAKIFLNANDFSANNGDHLTLRKNGKELGELTYCHSMKELPDGALALYKGSSLGLLEIGTVRKLGTAKELGLTIGDVVEIIPDH
ncbi:hypothetical protein COU91_02930 [Candidatus Saccharibacteria bacterium CG10_big_fil_rev_8_21_14_0_10_47_8]|nr:MAG: hypothetical protein COU91_02930 [Candidatus Saccharibacteria bacterium CG10_big_fil_rev_8_21_14_0_10_47_8]